MVMSSPTSLEMHIPATAMNQLRTNGSVNVGNVTIREWDGPAVRLFRIVDLETANLVHTLQKERPHSISRSMRSANGKINSSSTNSTRTGRKNSISRVATRAVRKQVTSAALVRSTTGSSNR